MGYGERSGIFGGFVRTIVGCYWVGSLDFNFWGNNGVLLMRPAAKLFAGGSTATNNIGQCSFGGVESNPYGRAKVFLSFVGATGVI